MVVKIEPAARHCPKAVDSGEGLVGLANICRQSPHHPSIFNMRAPWPWPFPPKHPKACPEDQEVNQALFIQSRQSPGQ